MHHPFFRNVKWAGLAAKALPAPIIPSLCSDDEVSAFDASFTTLTPAITPSTTTGTDSTNSEDVRTAANSEVALQARWREPNSLFSGFAFQK